MKTARDRREIEEMRTFRKSGLSMSRAARHAQNRTRKSRLVLAATLCLSVGYVGIAAVYGLRAVSAPPDSAVQTVRVEEPVPVPTPVPVAQPITAELREEIFQAELARRGDIRPVAEPAVAVALPELGAAGPDIPDCVDRVAAMASGLRLPFALGSVTPEGTALQSVAAFAAAVQTCPEALVTVEGHSDASGTDYLNMQLSWARAENTIAYLADVGLDTQAYRPIGYGTRLPAAEGDSDSEDAINRRVDFSVMRRAQSDN